MFRGCLGVGERKVTEHMKEKGGLVGRGCWQEVGVGARGEGGRGQHEVFKRIPQ